MKFSFAKITPGSVGSFLLEQVGQISGSSSELLDSSMASFGTEMEVGKINVQYKYQFLLKMTQ